MPGATARVRPFRDAVSRTTHVSGAMVSIFTTSSVMRSCSCANDCAATRAAAPRRRGYCSGGTITMGVAPADCVSTRSASAARTVASIRSHAAVTSPLMYTCEGSMALTTAPRPETEVPSRRQQRGERLGVAAARSGDQVVDRQRGDIGRHRPLAQVAPEIARERRQVRDVDLPASAGAAPAARAVEIQRDVAELAGDVVLAAHQLPARAPSPTPRPSDTLTIHEIAGRPGVARRPELRQRARLAGVLDLAPAGRPPRRSRP